MTGSFSESATLDCWSKGIGGNSAELTHGQRVPQPANFGVDFEFWLAVFFGAQQLRVVVTADLLQHDFGVELEPDWRHWQPPPVPQLPQQALALETVRQLEETQDLPQSDVCPSTVLNIVSTSKAAIEGRGTVNILQVRSKTLTTCIFRNDPVESKRNWGILQAQAMGTDLVSTQEIGLRLRKSRKY